jgi:hypothetical protein
MTLRYIAGSRESQAIKLLVDQRGVNKFGIFCHR